MEKVIRQIRQDFPNLSFVAGSVHSWSPQGQRIFYSLKNGKNGLWGLLHELGHAQLGHTSYSSDLDLLRKEVSAWEEATRLGQLYDVDLQRNYIEDCLDTYRDWLYKRSTCPRCLSKGLQTEAAAYLCLSCQAIWKVTPSRFCRPYRSPQKK